MKNKTLIHILILLIVYFFVHINFFKFDKQTKNIENTKVFADYSYYLEGALSIFEFNDLNIKFNNKKQPIAGSPKVFFTEKENKNNIIAFLYPFPSFKYGYSLISALITWPFDQDLFKYRIHRLAFVNLILGGLLLIIIFVSIRRLNLSLISAYAASSLYIFDRFNIFNNYNYQSHTLSGIFFCSLAFCLFANNQKNKINFFFISLFLSFSILSSSHFLIFAFSLGLLIWLNYIYNRKIYDILVISLSGLFGALIFPTYIYFVEKFFNFKEKMIPGFFGQFRHYSNTVGNLIDTYPILQRNLWSFDLWNPFIKYVFLFVLLIFIVNFFNLKKKFEYFNLSVVKKINYNVLILNKKFIFVFAFFIFFFTVAFYSQPITRGMVPLWFGFNIIFGCIIGCITKKLLRWVSFIFLVISLVLNFLFFNFFEKNQILNKIDTFSYLTFPTKPQDAKNIILVNEIDLIWKKITFYYKDGNYKHLKLSGGDLGSYSLDLKKYLNEIKKDFPIYFDDPKHTYIRVMPAQIVHLYANTRRIIRKFSSSDTYASADVIKNDFKLILDIYDLIRSKKIINNIDYFKYKILYYPSNEFDNEYIYIYSYNEKIKERVVDTSIELIDFRSVYYFRLSSLLDAARSK